MLENERDQEPLLLHPRSVNKRAGVEKQIPISWKEVVVGLGDTTINKLVKDMAVNMYGRSLSARIGLGLQVLKKLRSMPDSAFVWAENVRYDVFGLTEEGILGGLHIGVPKRLEGKVEHLSLELVHEGVHVLKFNEWPVIEQELHASRLQLDYFRELCQGIRWGANVYRLCSLEPSEMKRLKATAEGTLIDPLVRIYKGEGLSGEWVISHIDYWGGHRKRDPLTLVYYLRALSNDKNQGSRALEVCLKILEAISADDFWNEIPENSLPPKLADYFRSLRSGADRTRLDRLNKAYVRLRIRLP